jgi:hypothetical protein
MRFPSIGKITLANPAQNRARRPKPLKRELKFLSSLSLEIPSLDSKLHNFGESTVRQPNGRVL